MAHTVGFIVALADKDIYVVWCEFCQHANKATEFAEHSPVELLFNQIYPASQDCHLCGCLMVKPEASWWDDAYPNLLNVEEEFFND
jgi:hypothetical protein